MKQLLILLLVFSAIQTNAQWYYERFGVNEISELNEKELNIALRNANLRAGIGMVYSILGITMLTSGIVILSNHWNDEYKSGYGSGIDNTMTAATQIGGGFLVLGGAVCSGIAIPVCITGFSRRSQITLQLAKFNDTSYIPSIGIRISF